MPIASRGPDPTQNVVVGGIGGGGDYRETLSFIERAWLASRRSCVVGALSLRAVVSRLG